MTSRGFTRSDLLACLAATAVILGLGSPLLSAGRGLARGSRSAQNLRVQHLAHMVYAADWNGRQLTFIDDEISSYGPNVHAAFDGYRHETGRDHPAIWLGGGHDEFGQYRYYAYQSRYSGNRPLFQPIEFSSSSAQYFGSFRLFNAAQFHKYTGGRFYDKAFYAPEDAVVFAAVESCFANEDQFSPTCADVSDAVGDIPGWSSYCLSPAAMFDPTVLGHDDPDVPGDGFQDPWSFDHAFRSPSFSQARYANLKTHVLEHHWYDAPESCNPSFIGTYGDPPCEPFYFNHGLASRPLGLFYDGHVGELPIAQVIIDDEHVRKMTGSPNWGLWSKDTPFGEDGYLSEYGYDSIETSPHVLTTDGILGRDILGP